MKKMKRALFCCCLGIFFLISCSSNKILKKPADTTLEFWVADKVSSEDFDGHNSLSGIFGGYAYYGKDYGPDVSQEDNYLKPKYYVIYTVTAYPDYSSNDGKYDTVTDIEITDPNVKICGITCNSSFEDFDQAFKKLGCKISSEENTHLAKFGKTRILFFKYKDYNVIRIRVKVTNKKGIQF